MLRRFLLLAYGVGLCSAQTASPTLEPSYTPSFEPTIDADPDLPTVEPTFMLSESPTSQSQSPSTKPSYVPSWSPSVSGAPTGEPSVEPTSEPSAQPSWSPTMEASDSPTWMPSWMPSWEPSAEPTVTGVPSWEPSYEPTGIDTDEPSAEPTVTPDQLIATLDINFGENLANSSAVQDAIAGVLSGVLAVMPEGAEVNVEVVMTTVEETTLFINGATLPEDVKEDIIEAVTAVRCTGLLTCTITERMSRRRRLQTSQLNVEAESTLNQDTDLSQSTDFEDPDFVSDVNAEADSGTLNAATVTSRETTATAIVRVPPDTDPTVVEAVEQASEDTEAIQEAVEEDTGVSVEEITSTPAPGGGGDGDDDDDDGLSGGAIAGIVIGVTVFVGVVVVGGFLWYQGRADQPDTNARASDNFASRITETEQATTDV